ncbi:MAG: ComEC/Rec2 family competence protein, partial [Cyanobacteria bacterium P01_E01_bin.45]
MIHTYWIALAWLLGLLLQFLVGGWLAPPVLATAMVLRHRHNLRLVRTLLMAGLVGLLAWGYAQIRQPIAPAGDISIHAPQANVTVVARVESLPRQTNALRQNIWVSTQKYGAENVSPIVASGKLYVTYNASSSNADSAQSEGDHIAELLPGQVVELHGYLYEPSG